MRLVTKVCSWYRGEYIPPENDPSTGVVILVGHYKRPPLAKALGAIGRFWLGHWKWIITTGLAAWYAIHKLVK